jgi:hypothetical protein
MHVLSPRPSDPKMPMFFNVDSHVGPGCPNKLHDVMFVQFCFRTIGKVTLAGSTTPPDLRARMAVIRLDGTCDAHTSAIILDWQKYRKQSKPGVTADGKVSPSSGGTNYGSGVYSIAELNMSLKRRFPDVWPMLGKMPECPGGLAAAAKAAMLGDIS